MNFREFLINESWLTDEYKLPKDKEKMIGWSDKGKRYYYLFTEEEIHKLFKEAGFKILSSHNSEMMINFIVKKK